MSNKTECKYYNEDDFVEREGSLHEITVEITLCEYRNLIQERIYNEKTIDKLQEENKDLNESVEILTGMLFDGNPELRNEMYKVIKAICNTFKMGEQKHQEDCEKGGAE
jgi:hypothetical protein